MPGRIALLALALGAVVASSAAAPAFAGKAGRPAQPKAAAADPAVFSADPALAADLHTGGPHDTPPDPASDDPALAAHLRAAPHDAPASVDPALAADLRAALQPANAPPDEAAPPADASGEPSGVAARFAAWVTASDDNGTLPFMIVDKLAAEVSAFDASGQLLGRAPVLVGLARGDDSAPGIGEEKLSAISPDERTTPAGRFVATFGPSAHGPVLWIDYDNSISMHPVITTNPKEHRLQRIKSSSPDEHRISFGCINVPAKFYHDVVQKAFHGGVLVYILPDTKPLADFFPAFAAADYADDGSKPMSQAERCADPLLREIPTYLETGEPRACP